MYERRYPTSSNTATDTIVINTDIISAVFNLFVGPLSFPQFNLFLPYLWILAYLTAIPGTFLFILFHFFFYKIIIPN